MFVKQWNYLINIYVLATIAIVLNAVNLLYYFYIPNNIDYYIRVL